MTPSADTAIEKNIKNRQDIVLGVSLAVVAGFLVNTFSSIFYDIAISKTLTIGDISSTTLAVLFILLILLEAYLEFLIYDVGQGQDIKIDIRFWGRFFDFVEKKHWMNRVTKSIMNMAWLGAKIIAWLGVLISLLITENHIILTIFIIGTVTYMLVKQGVFCRHIRRSEP